MNGRLLLLAVLIFFISGCSTALMIHAEGHAKTARSENKEAASIIVAVNDTKGPVTGLNINNFKTIAQPVAASGCFVDITRAVNIMPGSYMLDIIPIESNPTCVWKTGKYIISVLVNKDSKSGVGVTDLEITQDGSIASSCASKICDDAIVIKSSPSVVNEGLSAIALLPCDEGYKAVAGGYRFDNPSYPNSSFKITRDAPGSMGDGRTAWIIHYVNTGPRAEITFFTTCVKTSS